MGELHLNEAAVGAEVLSLPVVIQDAICRNGSPALKPAEARGEKWTRAGWIHPNC